MPSCVWRNAGLDVVLKSRVLTTIGSNTLLTFSASVILTYWLIAARPLLADMGPAWVVNALAFVALILALYLVVLADRTIRNTFRRASNPGQS